MFFQKCPSLKPIAVFHFLLEQETKHHILNKAKKDMNQPTKKKKIQKKQNQNKSKPTAIPAEGKGLEPGDLCVEG